MLDLPVPIIDCPEIRAFWNKYVTGIKLRRDYEEQQVKKQETIDNRKKEILLQVKNKIKEMFKNTFTRKASIQFSSK